MYQPTETTPKTTPHTPPSKLNSSFVILSYFFGCHQHSTTVVQCKGQLSTEDCMIGEVEVCWCILATRIN